MHQTRHRCKVEGNITDPFDGIWMEMELFEWMKCVFGHFVGFRLINYGRYSTEAHNAAVLVLPGGDLLSTECNILVLGKGSR